MSLAIIAFGLIAIPAYVALLDSKHELLDDDTDAELHLG
jgi:hypothetical protein